MSTPMGASCAPAVDKSYHPAFAVGAKETTSMLRREVQAYEDICREMFVVLNLDPETTPCHELPVIMEQRLRATKRA